MKSIQSQSELEKITNKGEQTMNFLEALNGMFKGKKVQLLNWEDEYLYLENGIIYDEEGIQYELMFDDINNDNWRFITATNSSDELKQR